MNIYTRSLNDAFKGFRSIASSLGTKTTTAPPASINLDDLPSKPKRPAAGWNRFVMQKKDLLQGPNRMDVMKDLADKWKSMSKYERAPYDEAAQQEMRAYRVQLMEYKNVMNQTVPLSEVVKIMKLTKKSKVKSHRPKSGWNLFMSEVMAKDRVVLSNGKPDLSAIAKSWNSLSDSQKQAYNDRARHQA